jgi:hypothetical protein
MPVGPLTEDQIEQYDLSQTLPWIGLTPSQHNSSIPANLENRSLDELLDPLQFSNPDEEVEQFCIARPRSEMFLVGADA